MRLSYSSIQTYETCPAKFRFQYEDRVPTRSSPALSFGDSLHQALHRFHDRPVPVPPPLEDLLEILDGVWVSDGYTDASEEAQYLSHARAVLAQYHRENAGSYRIPAALEHRFQIEVEGVTLSGIIDRMDRLPGGGYEIIDYKTNRRLPPMSRIEQDLQLSIYHLAAKEVWGIEPERLTLYFLLPNQRMTTSRSPAQIDELRRRIALVAERVETGHFEARENPLCNWCDFQHLCPVFRHKFERESAPKIIEVVDEWVRLKKEHAERWKQLDELAAVLRAYAKEHGLKRLYGNDGAVSLVERVEQATDPQVVRRLLEPLGLYESVLTIDPAALGSLIERRMLPPDVEDELLASRDAVKTSTALYLRDREGNFVRR